MNRSVDRGMDGSGTAAPGTHHSPGGVPMAHAHHPGSASSRAVARSAIHAAGNRLWRWWAWNVKSVPFAALALGRTALVTGTWTADV